VCERDDQNPLGIESVDHAERERAKQHAPRLVRMDRMNMRLALNPRNCAVNFDREST